MNLILFTRHFSAFIVIKDRERRYYRHSADRKSNRTVDDGRKEYALPKKDIENGLRVQADEDTLARLLSITARLRITAGDAIHIVSAFVFFLLHDDCYVTG